MGIPRLSFVVAIIASVATGFAAAAEPPPVPTYTSEDLERMFGPVEAEPAGPVARSGPEDWRWVEQFLDRQYARIDADRDYELRKLAIEPVAPIVPVYAQSLPWGLRYPASTWWNVVASSYGVDTHRGQHGNHDHGGWTTGCSPQRPQGGGRGSGGGRGRGHAHK
jgi:hypothetical protein